MTLATRVRIVIPLPPEQVFHKCRGLLGAAAHVRWGMAPDSYRPSVQRWANDLGQGLRAALWMYAGIDGPIPPFDDDPPRPDACIEVAFDTAYGYRDERGGCEALHRRLTAELGDWLDDRGADWWAQDEYSGVWYHRTPCPVP